MKKENKDYEDDYEYEENELEQEEDEDLNDEDEQLDEKEEIVDLNLDMDPSSKVGSPAGGNANKKRDTVPILNLPTSSMDDNYDHIKDPHVKKLMTLNVYDSKKEDVVNFLLESRALEKKEEKAPQTEKGKKKYNVESTLTMEKLNEDPKYKSGNYFINAIKENPEFTNDFSMAVKKLLSKMTKESNQDDLLKLLVSDRDKLNSDIERLESVNRDYIDNKVKTYISNKQKKVESIQEKLNDEFMTKHTFNPVLYNTEKNNIIEKRNLEQFLSDQSNHNKKIQDKIKYAQEENLKKEIEQITSSNPKIDNNSVRIFEEKFKTDEPTHLRLYKKRHGANKKEILKKDESNLNDKIRSKKKSKVEELMEKKEKDKRPITGKEADQHRHNLYQRGLDKKQRIENLKNKLIEEEEKGKNANKANFESNQVFLESVMEKFRKIIESIFQKLVETQNNVGTSSLLNEGSNSKELEATNIQLNRLTLIQISEVLYNLGFLEFKINKTENSSEKETTESNEDKLFHKQSEKKLTCELWEVLKDSEGYVNVDHLFIFILAVINLYEFYLYSSYKKSRQEATSPEKTEKKQKKLSQEELLQMLANDINNKIVTSTKYGAFDENGNFLITFDKAKLINKDFKIFYINFMNKKAHFAQKAKKQTNDTYSFQATHRPHIDEKSNRIYSEYRNRVLDINKSTDNLGARKEKGLLDYIDKLIYKKKKKENMNAKIKEEQKDKEMEECTFKPKINEDYISSREGIENDTRKGRWDQLYKTGIQIVSSRKDKPKDIIEVELYGKECTFRPQLFNEPVKDDGKIHNDIYNEKSYELLYSRLKNGRIQRILKESVHERGDFPNELNEIFSSPRKELNITVKTQNSNSFKQPKTKNKKDENNALNSNSHRANINSSGNDSNQEEVVENFNNEPEKKDAIPLLIIDVNIRPGVKKKIYVFDGDTSEGLSEKFAKEHNLDNDTKAKLQVLIQSHMSRLLMRIDEENQSVSEKSSTYNLS